MTPVAKISAAWVFDAAPQALCSMLEDAGFEAYFVGGCVRNALLGVPISDIDIATNARPETVSSLAKENGFHPVPTGIEHGTVTVVVEGEPFEITTYRKDVKTDGRRAVVNFANTLVEDAHRRDFTMNALYLSARGEVIDPLGGMADLAARRVRFIDDAGARIREDFLRILRFFRFHAWYGDVSAGPDPEALDAIARNSDGVETLSRERVGAEMRKLLSAENPAPAVALMEQTGVLARVIAGAAAKALSILIHFEQEAGISPNPMLRLSALGGEGQVEALRLSKADARHLETLLKQRGTLMGASELGYRLGAGIAKEVLMLNAALLEMPLAPGVLSQAILGAEQEFPIDAADLMPAYQGAALGAKLKELEAIWIGSNFTMNRETLLEGL